MALTAGTRLGSYEVLGLIAAGGMGEVYRVRDTRLGREVALKLLPPFVAEDPERRARFDREARVLASLNHPNIIAVYSVEEADHVPFFTMELVNGTPLAELIPASGVTPARAIELCLPIASALAAAHARGVIHRDLKPANVMVTPDGTVKVL